MEVYGMYVGEGVMNSYRPHIYRDYEKQPYGSLEANANPIKGYYDIVQGRYSVTLSCYLYPFVFESGDFLHEQSLYLL